MSRNQIIHLVLYGRIASIGAGFQDTDKITGAHRAPIHHL